ncbi:MAG: hypothetical protein ACOYL9_00560 [Ilumatobacteraceae bacterium]
MLPRTSDRTPRRVLLAVAVTSLIALTGCITGERPTLDQAAALTGPGAATGDPAIDAVLALLDTVDAASFRAEYSVQPATRTALTASVERTAATATNVVTIGDYRFITDANGSRTCTADESVCEDGILPAKVSDAVITPDFAQGDMAKRLRFDAMRKTGATTASTTTIAGVAATCVDVPVSGGTKQYCVLPDGVIASFVGGDVTLTLTSYAAI